MFLLKKGIHLILGCSRFRCTFLAFGCHGYFNILPPHVTLQQQTRRFVFCCWSPGKPMIRWVVDNLSLSADDTLVVIYNPAWMSMKNFMYLAPTKTFTFSSSKLNTKNSPPLRFPGSERCVFFCCWVDVVNYYTVMGIS